MLNLWLLPLDVGIGYVEETVVANAFNSSGDGTSLLEGFASIFTSGFNMITGNPALFAILCVAVGAPILGAVVSIFRGK